MLISAVIPTYKRPESLLRTLGSIAQQELIPGEVIVVSGEETLPSDEKLKTAFPSLNISVVHTEASVCLQRNTGIRKASGKYVLLCDDDVELAPNYLKVLAGFLEQNPEKDIAAGTCMENINGSWLYEFRPRTFSSLLYKFIFFHGLWGSVDELKGNWITAPVLRRLQAHYRRLGNTKTRAGWPLITQFENDRIETLYYALGASVIRREYFGTRLFDEVLDRSGIGDNYGIAVNAEDRKTITILKESFARHHKEMNHRLSRPVSYFRRIMAMDYFLRINNKKTWTNHLCLIWSVKGSLLAQLIKGNGRMAYAGLRVLRWLICYRNPYFSFKKKGKKFCSP